MRLTLSGVATAAIILAPFALTGLICWLDRRDRRKREEAGRKAVGHALRTARADGPSPSNGDAVDRMIEDAALMFRDDPAQTVAWPPGPRMMMPPAVPADLDRLDEYRAIWTAKYGKGER